MFQEVFSFAHKPHYSKVTRAVIRHVDVTIFEASVVDEDGADRCVSLNRADCTDALCQLVTEGGGAFRVECVYDNTQTCVSLFLMVDPNVVDGLLPSRAVPGEEHAIMLARQVWREAMVADKACEAVRPAEGLASVASWREDEFPLYPHQEQTVSWMMQLESMMPLRFEYSGNLRVTDHWFIDTEEECFTSAASPREAHLKGGICTDGTGAGKTATLLNLVARTRSSAPRARYATDATLAIIPLNLTSQWQSEFKKFVRDASLNVVFLLGKEIRNMTMRQICDADLVVTTFHFLRASKVYAELLEGALNGKARSRPVLSSWARADDRVHPVLEAVHWKRVVVDEVHETLESPRDIRQLRLFTWDCIWGLTATPRLDADRAQHLYMLLHREKAHHPNLLSKIIQLGVRCHFHSTDLVPSPLKSLWLVELSEEERARLKLGEIDDVAALVRRCTIGGSDASTQSVNSRREILKLKIEGHERALRVLERVGVELDERAQTLEEGDELDHARRARQMHEKDVIAARQCLDTEITRLHNLAHVAPLSEDAVHTKMAKIGELILALREPVILFVQWKSMVRHARTYLTSVGVRVLSLDGNTAQRTATLAEFMSFGVLLLSLEESFAGLHLPHVRQIIFAHAIVGDVKQVEHLETQAIARCARHGQKEQVNVYSFVVTETEEEHLWRRTH